MGMSQEAPVKLKGIPDIVICLDVTGSMGPCLEQLKAHLGTFIAELEAPREVQGGAQVKVSDWRLRLVPYRDLEEPADVAFPGLIDDFPFCTTTAEFQSQLSDPRCKANKGGKEPESALDAIYSAVKNSPWRPEKEAHRFVILFTDATTLPTMHASTTKGGPADVEEVIQAIKTAKIKPILFAPTAPEYAAIYDGVKANKTRGGIAEKFPLYGTREDAVAFFKMDTDAARAQFAKVLDDLAATISSESSEEL